MLGVGTKEIKVYQGVSTPMPAHSPTVGWPTNRRKWQFVTVHRQTHQWTAVTTAPVSLSTQSMAASLVGPELLMLHTEPFTALLQFRINKCLFQLRDMGPLKIALTYNTSSLQFLSSSTTEKCSTWCFQSWEEIKIFLLIFIMNKSSCRRNSAHTFQETTQSIQRQYSIWHPKPWKWSPHCAE